MYGLERENKCVGSAPSSGEAVQAGTGWQFVASHPAVEADACGSRRATSPLSGLPMQLRSALRPNIAATLHDGPVHAAADMPLALLHRSFSL